MGPKKVSAQSTHEENAVDTEVDFLDATITEKDRKKLKQKILHERRITENFLYMNYVSTCLMIGVVLGTLPAAITLAVKLIVNMSIVTTGGVLISLTLLTLFSTILVAKWISRFREYVRALGPGAKRDFLRNFVPHMLFDKGEIAQSNAKGLEQLSNNQPHLENEITIELLLFGFFTSTCLLVMLLIWLM